MKKRKFLSSFFIIAFLLITNINYVQAAHTHNSNCYNGTMHTHSESCYSSSAGYGVCGGALNWVQTDVLVEKCPYCEFIGYTVEVYQAICPSCNNTYIDYVQTVDNSNIIHYCGDREGIKYSFNQPTYPQNYPKRTNSTDTMSYGQSSSKLTCGKENGAYYDDTGKKCAALCSNVAISIQPVTPTQTTNNPDFSIIVTFLDGHTYTMQPYYTNYESNKTYNNENVTLVYYGEVKNVGNTDTLTTTMLLTSENVESTTIETVENVEEPVVEENIDPTPTIEENQDVVLLQENEDITTGSTPTKEKELSKIEIFFNKITNIENFTNSKYPIKSVVIAMGVILALSIIGKIATKE